jgi:hypothetical protein
MVHTSGVVRTLAAAVVLLSLLPSGAAATEVGSRHASVKLTRAAPVTIEGRGFAAAERVRLTVWANGEAKKNVVADANGRFAARFRSVSFDRCAGLTAKAVGNSGSRVTYRTPRLLCPPRL